MSQKIVLIFSGQGANDAVRGLMMEFGAALEASGQPVVHVDPEPAELQYAVERMQQGEVRFALTWLGMLQELSIALPDGSHRNVWDAFRTPLVKIHGDSPAYFADRHRDVPKTSVNLYMAPEFAEFREQWLPEERSLAGLVPPWPMSGISLSAVDRGRRERGRLVFLKNGNSPAELIRRWEGQLAPTISTLLKSMAEEILPKALRPGYLNIGSFVAGFLKAAALETRTLASQVIFFSAQLDDYVRRVKSEMIATALLDFPVLIQGDAWGHVNFSGRRAQLVAGRSFGESVRIFQEELGIVDMSPNLDLAPHDRVQRAAGMYSLVLTNRQSWMNNRVPGFDAMQFEFSPESIASRVEEVLSDPKRAVDLGVEFGAAFRGAFSVRAFADAVFLAADLAALVHSDPRPSVQPFFVWSA